MTADTVCGQSNANSSLHSVKVAWYKLTFLCVTYWEEACTVMIHFIQIICR